jgi:hypothetical protein
MRTYLLAAAICITCVSCGTFNLDAGSKAPPGKTQDQITLDTMVCKDKARVESQTAADQARGFVLGATLSFVGAAIDYDQQKKDQRRIFKECMEAKGYTVLPPSD